MANDDGQAIDYRVPAGVKALEDMGAANKAMIDGAQGTAARHLAALEAPTRTEAPPGAANLAQPAPASPTLPNNPVAPRGE